MAKAEAEKKRLAAEEAKKREALAKAEEEKKREAAAKAAEEEKKREALAKAEELKKREAAAKAEEERKQQLAKAEEAKRKAEEAKPRVDTADLFRRAADLESNGKIGDAVKLYTAAANANHGPSAKKLGDIFGGGKGDVGQDYTQSLRWYQKARQLGETVPGAKGR